MWVKKISKILLTYLISATIISEFLWWYSCYEYFHEIRVFISDNNFIVYVFLTLIYLLCTLILYKNTKMYIKNRFLWILYMVAIFLISGLLLYVFFYIIALIHVIIVVAVNNGL